MLTGIRCSRTSVRLKKYEGWGTAHGASFICNTIWLGHLSRYLNKSKVVFLSVCRDRFWKTASKGFAQIIKLTVK